MKPAKICPQCGKKIRWYHTENSVYFSGEMQKMHDACAWRFLLAETERIRMLHGGGAITLIKINKRP